MELAEHEKWKERFKDKCLFIYILTGVTRSSSEPFWLRPWKTEIKQIPAHTDQMRLASFEYPESSTGVCIYFNGKTPGTHPCYLSLSCSQNHHEAPDLESEGFRVQSSWSAKWNTCSLKSAWTNSVDRYLGMYFNHPVLVFTNSWEGFVSSAALS